MDSGVHVHLAVTKLRDADSGRPGTPSSSRRGLRGSTRASACWLLGVGFEPRFGWMRSAWLSVGLVSVVLALVGCGGSQTRGHGTASAPSSSTGRDAAPTETASALSVARAARQLVL